MRDKIARVYEGRMRTMGSASSLVAAGPEFNKRARQNTCGYEILHQAQSCTNGSSTIQPNWEDFQQRLAYGASAQSRAACIAFASLQERPRDPALRHKSRTSERESSLQQLLKR
jgi:hypothetical protein